jgi:hypothetical protein
MATRRHLPGYHCSKALRLLGLEADAVAHFLRKELALDTDEIEEVLAFPITPPEGTTIDLVEVPVDRREERRVGIPPRE